MAQRLQVFDRVRRRLVGGYAASRQRLPLFADLRKTIAHGKDYSADREAQSDRIDTLRRSIEVVVLNCWVGEFRGSDLVARKIASHYG